MLLNLNFTENIIMKKSLGLRSLSNMILDCEEIQEFLNKQKIECANWSLPNNRRKVLIAQSEISYYYVIIKDQHHNIEENHIFSNLTDAVDQFNKIK